jgi:hypothetical protein
MKGAFCSFDRKFNLDLMDSIPSLLEEEAEDLLSFSNPNIFPSIFIHQTFLVSWNQAKGPNPLSLYRDFTKNSTFKISPHRITYQNIYAFLNAI